ncbi:hypothetical protein FGIG_09794, partial [Fasciola gigantica]
FLYIYPCDFSSPTCLTAFEAAAWPVAILPRRSPGWFSCASRDLLCTALDQGPVYEASVASECWDWGLTVPLREVYAVCGRGPASFVCLVLTIGQVLLELYRRIFKVSSSGNSFENGWCQVLMVSSLSMMVLLIYR